MRNKTEQAVVVDPTHPKITDQLCGRLIVWDVGTPCEDVVVFAREYCHRKYNLSPQVELKPCVSDDSQERAAAAAVKAATKRFALNFYHGSSLKKPLLQ